MAVIRIELVLFIAWDLYYFRTDTQYEDSMIVKVFVFLFINSYASFYYLAFIAELVGDCPVQGCMYTLAINVCIVFGSSLASSVFMQIIFPYVGYKYRYFCTNYGSTSGDVSGGTSTDSLNQYVENSVHNQVYHSIGSVVEHNVTADSSTSGITGGGSGGGGGSSGSNSNGNSNSNRKQGLGLRILELTGDVTPTMEELNRADILIVTPEKWDSISRGWQKRGYVQKVQLVIIDEIHLLGVDRGPVLVSKLFV